MSEKHNWENWSSFKEALNDIRVEVQPREPMAMLIHERGEIKNIENVEHVKVKLEISEKTTESQ